MTQSSLSCLLSQLLLLACRGADLMKRESSAEEVVKTGAHVDHHQSSCEACVAFRRNLLDKGEKERVKGPGGAIVVRFGKMMR